MVSEVWRSRVRVGGAAPSADQGEPWPTPHAAATRAAECKSRGLTAQTLVAGRMLLRSAHRSISGPQFSLTALDNRSAGRPRLGTRARVPCRPLGRAVALRSVATSP